MSRNLVGGEITSSERWIWAKTDVIVQVESKWASGKHISSKYLTSFYFSLLISPFPLSFHAANFKVLHLNYRFCKKEYDCDPHVRDWLYVFGAAWGSCSSLPLCPGQTAIGGHRGAVKHPESRFQSRRVADPTRADTKHQTIHTWQNQTHIFEQVPGQLLKKKERKEKEKEEEVYSALLVTVSTWLAVRACSSSDPLLSQVVNHVTRPSEQTWPWRTWQPEAERCRGGTVKTGCVYTGDAGKDEEMSPQVPSLRTTRALNKAPAGWRKTGRELCTSFPVK